MRSTRRLLLFCSVIFFCFALPVQAVTPSAAEFSRANRWVSAKVLGQILPPERRSYLAPNRSGMQRNEHQGRPLRIGATDFSSGLFMGSANSVTVHLASPAQQLEATVGLDGRSYGCGYSNRKQQFSVQVGGQTVARSAEVEVGQEGIPLHADLRGATEFRLVDGSANGENWCKEAVWANPRVLLRDGTKINLGELPIGDGADATDNALPFSFTYGGKPASALLGSWNRKISSRAIGGNGNEYDLSWTDPATGLIVRMMSKVWRDSPVVEWTLYFENGSDAPTPILENVAAIDTELAVPEGAQPALHHFRGSPAGPTDFEPFLTALDKGSAVHLATSGGRSSDESMPYFNLDESGQGVIVGLGWPGQWSADFLRDSDGNVRVRAGQELTHFRLLPHEQVRTPLVALLFWNANNWMRGQNLWRSWMLEDNLPRFSNGKIQPHLAASSSLWFAEMGRATEQSQKQFLDRYRELGLKPDLWWMDAGWYARDGDWWKVGTWSIDPERFPNGLRPVTDHAHAMGVDSIVWFELERVVRDSDLWREHPDWLLSNPEAKDDRLRLLNLGDPDAEKWVVSFLDRFITQQGIDVYRIDFNIAPLPYWRHNDAPDRQGITEIRYVTGFLDYLDQLRKLHPHLLIDTCASGGRRDDLETLRRAVPMHRSDFIGDPTGSQNIGYGLAFWVPYFGAANNARDSYVFRSSLSPQVNVGWDVRQTDLNFAWMRSAIAQWRSVAPDMLGDYYPLLPYDPTENAWMAWQYDRPDLKHGMIQAFRRGGSASSLVLLKLHGLDANAKYAVTDIDTKITRSYSGTQLMNFGIEIKLPIADSSALLSYTRQNK